MLYDPLMMVQALAFPIALGYETNGRSINQTIEVGFQIGIKIVIIIIIGDSD